jgi:hypothetical protein
MFNHQAYQTRLDEIKKEITTADDQTWLMDVSLRYGRFLAERSLEQLARVIDQVFPAYELVDDKQKHRDYCANEIMGVVSGMYSSSALIRGAVKIGDPLGAEAMMRIYAEANSAPKSTEPAPMAVEGDFSFRGRVYQAASLAGENQDILESIDRSAGLALDYRGKKYGLVRTNGSPVQVAGSASEPDDRARAV